MPARIECCLYGQLLEDMCIDKDDPLSQLIKIEDRIMEEEGYITDLPSTKQSKTSKTFIIRRHKMSLNTIVSIVSETNVLQPDYEGATPLSQSLYMSLAWVGAGAAVRSLRNIDRISNAMGDMEVDSAPHKLEAKKLKDAENEYDEGMNLYSFCANQIPEHNRELVMPEAILERMSEANITDLDVELDFDDARVEYARKKLHASKAMLTAAHQANIESAKRSREEQAKYVTSVHDKLHADMKRHLENAESSLEIGDTMYKRCMAKLNTKLRGAEIKALGYIIDMTGRTSEETKVAAFGNHPILESISKRTAEIINKFQREDESSTEVITNDAGEVVIS